MRNVTNLIKIQHASKKIKLKTSIHKLRIKKDQ